MTAPIPVGSFHNNSGASSVTSVSVTVTGVSAGDWLTCCVSIERNTATPGVPTTSPGSHTFTLESGMPATGAAMAWTYGRYQLVSGDISGGNTTITSTVSGGNTRRQAITVNVYRTVDQIDFVSGTYTQNGDGVVTATAPSITPTYDDALVTSAMASCSNVSPFVRTQGVDAPFQMTVPYGSNDGSTSASSTNAYSAIATFPVTGSAGVAVTGATFRDTTSPTPTKFHWFAGTWAVQRAAATISRTIDDAIGISDTGLHTGLLITEDSDGIGITDDIFYTLSTHPISYIASSPIVTGTASCTPVIPGTAAVGDLGILQVDCGDSIASMPVVPSAWMLIGTQSGGGGTFGLNAGPRRLAFYVREITGSDVNPLVQMSSSTGSVIAAQIHVVRRNTGTGYRYAVTFATDTTDNTSFNATCPDQMIWAPDDFALIGYSLNNGSDVTSEAITAAGITFNGATELSDQLVDAGNQLQFVTAYCLETAGTTNVVTNITASMFVTGSGVAGVLRVRQAESTLTATVQGGVYPRILVEAQGLQGEGASYITIYRVVNGTLTTVRGADAAPTGGDDAFLVTDAEQPFGVPIYYVADITDALGNTWRITSNTVTTNITSMAMLSDAITGNSALIDIVSWPEEATDRGASIFNVNGRIVVVSSPRSSPSSTLTFCIQSNADRDAVNELLDTATNNVILLREQPVTGCSEVDSETSAYLVVVNDTITRNGRFRSPTRRVTLSVIEVEAWPITLISSGSTLQDIANAYPSGTLLDINNDFLLVTLLAIAEHDWTV